MADEGHGRSSEEIRRDIEGTRAEMHETVDALERKLSPGQLVDELWGRFSGGSSASAAAGVGTVVREHPVPLALMGLGVAWLVIERATASEGDRLRSRHGSVEVGTREPAEGRVGPYRGEDVSGPGRSGSERSEEGGAARKVKDKASDATRSVKGKAAEVGEKASAAASRAGEGLSRAGEEARHRGRQARRGLWSAMEEQPLALGAVAFGLGLAGGLAAPSTRLEDEAMGGAADAVKGEAKELARDAAESGKRVARDAAESARQEAERQGVAEDLEASVKQVATTAGETAKRRAREEELHPEGVKKRASRAKDRVKDKPPE